MNCSTFDAVQIAGMGSIGTTLGLFCLIATACGGFGGSAGPIAAPSSGPSPAASASAEKAFVPNTDRVAGEARLALTFPDGTRATLRYPAQLRLAEMGIQPGVTITWEGRWVVPPVVFRYGGPDPRLLDEASQPETYSAAEGITASLWRSAAKAPGYENRNVRRWLVFELPTWAVHVPVPDAVTSEHLVSTIHPQETGDGFIVLRTDPPAALSELSGEGGGSQLTLGDLEPVEGIVRPVAPGRMIQLNPDGCADRVHHIGPTFGATCLADGRIYLGVTSFGASSDRPFIEAVVEGVRVTKVRSPN